MNPVSLIPTPDVLPAPPWVFLALDLLLFAIHILLINIVLGSVLIAVFGNTAGAQGATAHTASRLPSSLALAINFGVAPLLFMQVIYGHLFYTSSILMAVYWLIVVPLLIIGYYALYIHAKKSATNLKLSRASLWLAGLILLYVGAMFVNNMTLMLQPDKWVHYFASRKGTFLNISDPTFLPRYFHFIVASIAVGGLFLAHARARQGKDSTGIGLKIFAYATMVQTFIGMWFLASIPKPFLIQFMGQNPLATTVLMTAFAGAIASIGAALSQRLRTTTVLFSITIAAMVLTRHNLRQMYLGGKFSLQQLAVRPQYGAMALFLAILIAGTLTIAYMVRLSRNAEERRAA